jgi:glycosyltransferase involved in cell wall biosynthesis
MMAFAESKPDTSLWGPLVSIITPCWNAGALVGDAIDSALAQTYPRVEVIVIDDGSTDRSLEVIRSFGTRVRWETGPNRGACAARNRGVQLARGELIQFLDADDVLRPEKIARMTTVAAASGRAAVPICDWERQDLSSPTAPTTVALNYAGEDPVAFCLERQLPTPSPLHWRVNLERVGGFDESLPCSQERDLHLRLACSGVSFVGVPEALYRVRRREGSVSSDFVRVLRQHERIFQRAWEGLAATGALTPSRRAAFARAFARDGRLCVRHGQAALARAYFSRANQALSQASVDAFRDPLLRIVARTIGPIAAEHVCQLAVSLGIRR